MPTSTELIKCHFCGEDLHPANNAMTRCMNGEEPAKLGFGWISVIVKPFREVPCCDICMSGWGDGRPEEVLLI